MSQYKFNVVDVIDQPDGTAKVILEFDDETKNAIKQMYGWKRWNTKKFEELLKTAILNYIDYKKSEGSNDGNF